MRNISLLFVIYTMDSIAFTYLHFIEDLSIPLQRHMSIHLNHLWNSFS